MKEYFSIAFTIITSLIASFVVGLFLYGALESLRVSIFCPVELSEGHNCYVEGWSLRSHWVSSIVSGVMAIISISVTALFQPHRRLTAIKAMLVTGLVIAIPFSFLIMSVWAYAAAITSGLLVFSLVKRLTNLRVAAFDSGAQKRCPRFNGYPK